MFKYVLLLALLAFTGLNADTSLVYDTDLESAPPGDVLVLDNPESEGMGEEEVYVVPDSPSHQPQNDQGLVYIAEDVPNNLPYAMVPEQDLRSIELLNFNNEDEDDVWTN